MNRTAQNESEGIMTRNLFCVLLIGVFAATASAEHIIDDFVEGDFNGGLSVSGPGSQTETESGLDPSHVIGGERVSTLNVTAWPGFGSATATIIDLFDELDYSNDSLLESELTFTYGATTPLGVDLSADDSFDFEVHHIDLASLDIQMTVWDSDSSDTVTLTITGIGILECPFSGFTGIDFSDIQKLEVTFIGPASVDLHVLRIGTDLEDRGLIGDFVWNDANQDGIQDVGESGVDGVTVKLWECGPDGAPGTADDVLVETTSTSGGDYLFDELPTNDYFVEFILPSGATFTSANQGTDDEVDSDADTTTGRTECFLLRPGERQRQWDAGIIFQDEPAAIGDFVWDDLNADGIQDAGEPGIENVTVNLYECGPDGASGTADDVFVASTTTDASGLYSFTGLAPGDYYVEFVPPAGSSLSPQDQGADDTVDSDADPTTGKAACTTLVSGENDTTWDAGLVREPTDGGCTFTIGYWKTHPEDWPVDELVLGDVVYTKAQALDLLWTPPKGDATILLAHQLIGAKLNVANGADPTDVAQTIADADDWLTVNPVGTNPKGPSRAIGISLSETLDDYNNGLIGPGHCDGQGSF